jgi:hypothetical protein
MPTIRGYEIRIPPDVSCSGPPFPSCARAFDHSPTNVPAPTADQTVVDRKPRPPTFAQPRIADDGPGSLQQPKSSIVRHLVTGKIHRGDLLFQKSSRLHNPANSAPKKALEDLAGSPLLHSLYHRWRE